MPQWLTTLILVLGTVKIVYEVFFTESRDIFNPENKPRKG